MESIVKRYQSKYRKIREDMVRWHDLQSQLLTEFGNAASITERLPVLLDAKKYGALRVVSGTRETLVAKQIESLEGILSSMKETLKEFHGIVKSFKKIWQDCHQQLNSCSKSQLQQRIGIHPSLAMCLEGFQKIYEMHLSEYLLKESLISSITWNTSSNDLNAMHQFLTDQPNIPKDEDRLLIRSCCGSGIWSLAALESVSHHPDNFKILQGDLLTRILVAWN